jgi:8-oxo-dGTP diphosphatase
MNFFRECFEERLQHITICSRIGAYAPRSRKLSRRSDCRDTSAPTNRIAASHFVPLGRWDVVNTDTLCEIRLDNIHRKGVDCILSQAVIIKGNKVLMVRQYVQRGDIVWNFPGGGIEKGETPEEACIREVREETGFEVRIISKMHFEEEKYTYRAEIISGTMGIDKSIKDNEDIIEIAWIPLSDLMKFDAYTRLIIDLFVGGFEGAPNFT